MKILAKLVYLAVITSVVQGYADTETVSGVAWSLTNENQGEY